MEPENKMQYAEDYKFLIDQLIGPGFSTKFYDEDIEYYKNKVKLLESSKSSDISEIKNEKIRLNRAIVEKEKAVERLMKIRRLIQEYKAIASYSARLDGNPVSSSGMFYSYETIYGVKRFVYSYQDIEEQINVALTLLGYRSSKLLDAEKSSIREMGKLETKIMDLLENSYGRNSIIFKNDNKTHINAPNSVYDLSQLPNLFDNILYFSNHRDSKFAPKDIDFGDIEINTMRFCIEGEKYCYEKYPRIEKINEILKDPLTTEDSKLIKAQNLYKEYSKNYIACQLIKYYLSTLNPYELKKYEDVVKNLENIVYKELKKCDTLRIEADRLYNTAKIELQKSPHLAEKFFGIKGEKLEKMKEDYSRELQAEREKNVTSTETKENLDNVENKKSTLTELEIKNLSSGYRSRYIQEKIKKSELGQLDYLEFLKQEYPDQVELIEYIRSQEKESRTIYIEYLRDRAKRIANNQKIIKFKDYVERIKGKEYYDLEIPLDVEEELKKEKIM